jgi:pimeloyl-ACP methyl ester carboxylesterase
MASRFSRLLSTGRQVSSNVIVPNRAASLAYNRYGEKSEHKRNPLVIGHGLFGHKHNWNSVAKALQQRLGNQIYVVDFRNHGDSPHYDSHTYPDMGKDLAEFMQEVVLPETGAKAVHLMGHSMGGKVCAFIALDPARQALVDKLVIVDIAPFRANNDSLFPQFVDAMKKVNLGQTRREIDAELEKDIPDQAVRSFLLTNLREDPANKDGFQWKINLNVLGNALNHLHTFAVVPGTFDQPTLFIYGNKSRYFTSEDRPVAGHYFSKAEFVEIPDAGHWVHADKPKEFIDAVVNFLK